MAVVNIGKDALKKKMSVQFTLRKEQIQIQWTLQSWFIYVKELQFSD